MRDPEWVSLTDAQKGQLVSIWLLAADKNGTIPSSPEVIQTLCHMNTAPDIKLFISLGFIVGDANMASTWRQHGVNVTPQTRLDKTRLEVKTSTSSQRDDPVRVPYSQIVDLYHETLPNHPKVKVLTNARKSSIRQRHVNDMDSDLEEWLSYFNLVKRSKFLTGQTQPVNGRKVFIADLEWICKESNFAKIYEGKYHG